MTKRFLSRFAPASRPLTLAIASVALAAGCSGGSPTGSATPAPAPKTYGLKIDNGAVGQAPANGKTLLAIYMIGSNLEDDLKPRNDVNDEDDNGGPVKTGSGTKNLLQLVAGYNALTDAQWMAHRGVHEHHDPFGLECRLRILPAWRPGNSNGIVTGPIVAMTPWLLTCHGPSERASGAGAEPSTSPQDDRGAR